MKKMGRPKGENNKDYVCTIRMDKNTLKRLETYCRLMDVAKSEAIRDAISKLVDEESLTIAEKKKDNVSEMKLPIFSNKNEK